jgi:hypothetical protein
MQYIGLATQVWSMGSNSGAIRINTLAAHIDSLTLQPPQVSLNYWCVLQNARMNNKMFCEWTAHLIAFDPAEMEQNGSSLFPSYTFLNAGTTGHPVFVNQSPSPAHTPLKGFLDAFEGLILSYQTFPYGSPHDSAIWMLDSSATDFLVSAAAPSNADTTYGVFLGVRFSNSMTSSKYLYQESRAFGFIH